MGAGMYVIGISSAVLIIITQFIMHKISYFANVASGGLIHMTIVKKSGAVEAMEEFLTKQHVEILGVKINKNKKEEIKLEFDVVYPPGFNKSALLAKIVEMDEVLQVTE